MTANANSKNRRWETGMFLVLAFIFVYLVRRSIGLNPVVFADEWYYSKFSRLTPLGESILPSYLYLWLMRGTSTCGTGFLDCGRIINVLAYVGAAPFIYLTARKFTTAKLAMWVTVMCTLMPSGSFTAYFMPESIYYFGFCFLSWYALARPMTNRLIFAISAGAILGVMSLIKVHALFLLPALCIYLVYISARNTEPHFIVRGATIASATIIATFAIKLALGYLVAGKGSLHLLGSFYSSAADGAKPGFKDMLLMTFVSGRGHVMALALLFAFPLAVTVQGLLGAVYRHQLDSPERKLHLFAFLMLGSTVGLTVLYTASIAKYGPYEGLRLHMRYYDFVFPLLLIIAANALAQPSTRIISRLPLFLAAGFGIVIALAALKLPLYVLVHVDAPDIISIVQNKALLYGIGALGLVILALWVRDNKIAPALFLFVMVPISLGWTELGLKGQMLPFVTDTEFDLAGKFVRDHIPADERGGITVFGSGVGQLMRVLFYIDNKDADFIDVPKDSPIGKEQMPLTKKWALVVNPHPAPAGFKIDAQTKDFTLLNLKGDPSQDVNVARMNQPFPVGPVASAEGLSHAEDTGRWSDAKHVVLHMVQPLPKKFILVLHAAAYGPNVNLPFTVRVGSSEKSLNLGINAADFSLPFDTDGSVDSIDITVPQPASPLSLNQSTDSRSLGIMLGSMTLKTAECEGTN
jgi:hypothetical protein